MPFLLELFSGTKSVGRVFEKAGWDVLAVDNSEVRSPDVCASLLDWDYRSALTPTLPTALWASPPCTTWSLATQKHRQLPDLAPRTLLAVEAELLVWRTLEIVHYLTAEHERRGTAFHWAIENPQGRLRHFSPMQALPRASVDYCMLGRPYRKRTDVWTSTPEALEGLECVCERHATQATRVMSGRLGSVPEGLTERLVAAWATP